MLGPGVAGLAAVAVYLGGVHLAVRRVLGEIVGVGRDVLRAKQEPCPQARVAG